MLGSFEQALSQPLAPVTSATSNRTSSAAARVKGPPRTYARRLDPMGFLMGGRATGTVRARQRRYAPPPGVMNNVNAARAGARAEASTLPLRDGDRRSTPDELVPAASIGLVSIDLDYAVDPRCNARGDCEVERASFRYTDASGVTRTGAVVDVHLPAQR
jgi:hypothetical protein